MGADQRSKIQCVCVAVPYTLQSKLMKKLLLIHCDLAFLYLLEIMACSFKENLPYMTA